MNTQFLHLHESLHNIAGYERNHRFPHLKLTQCLPWKILRKLWFNTPLVSSISNKLNKKGKTPNFLMENFYFGVWVFIVSIKHVVFNFEKNFKNVHMNINNSLKMQKLSYMQCSFLSKYS